MGLPGATELVHCSKILPLETDDSVISQYETENMMFQYETANMQQTIKPPGDVTSNLLHILDMTSQSNQFFVPFFWIVGDFLGN